MIMTYNDLQAKLAEDKDFELAIALGATFSEGQSKVGPSGEKVHTIAVTMSSNDFLLYTNRVRGVVAPPPPLPEIHPVFQAIVDKFLSRKSSTGYHHYEWDGGLSEPIKCELEYDPPEPGSREQGTGLQLEPDFPEAMTLVTAELSGIDIYPLLDDDQINSIQEKALKGGV
jgi:hypothetical protein